MWSHANRILPNIYYTVNDKNIQRQIKRKLLHLNKMIYNYEHFFLKGETIFGVTLVHQLSTYTMVTFYKDWVAAAQF